jgi:hypothetical protein
VEVQEDQPSGRVRTTVKDVTKDSYVGDAHVKVIGSRNADFISGQSDLRGVFVANGIQGTSTVIAQVDDRRYAFYRGKVELGPPPVPATAAPVAPSNGGPPMQRTLEDELLEGNDRLNRQNIERKQKNLKAIYEKNKKGVQVQETF